MMLLTYATCLLRRGAARLTEDRGVMSWWTIAGCLALMAAFMLFRTDFANGIHYVVNSFFQALHEAHAHDKNWDKGSQTVPHIGNPADKYKGGLYTPGKKS